MMTVADSDLPAIILDPREIRPASGKLMTIPISHSPATDGRKPYPTLALLRRFSGVQG
jgi:hypothetical protein